MTEITTTLGKSFLLAGVLPAVMVIILHDLLLVPWFPKTQHLYEMDFLGLKGGLYLVLSLFLALLLLTFNGFVVRWMTNGWPFTHWFIQYNRRRHAETHTAFLTRLADYQEAIKEEDSIESSQQKLEFVYELLQKEASQLHFPVSMDYLRATRLGNVFAVVSEYAYERYRMDISIYWSRLSAVIPPEYKSEIADAKTSFDFWLHLTVLILIFAVETLLLSWWLKDFLLLSYSVTTLVVAYGLYRVAVDMAYTMSVLIMNCFDLFRQDLLAQLGILQPKELAVEQKLWLKLVLFIRYGERTDYPSG